MLQKLAALCYGGSGFTATILVQQLPLSEIIKAATQLIIAAATLIALFRKKKKT